MNVNAKTPLRRLLAMLLCVAMLAGFAIPAFATDDTGTETQPGTSTEGGTNEGGNTNDAATGNVKVDNSASVILEKNATLNDDGTYSFELSAFGTAEEAQVAVSLPLDFVFVLDASGSMSSQSTWADLRVEKLKTALKGLTEDISEESAADDAWGCTACGENVLKYLSAPKQCLNKECENPVAGFTGTETAWTCKSCNNSVQKYPSQPAQCPNSECSGTEFVEKTYAEHKVSIMTFANGSTAEGAYYRSSSVNGRFKIWANTGIFVNGVFKNYYSDSASATKPYYTRVYADELDPAGTYYILYENTSGASAMVSVKQNSNGKWRFAKSDGSGNATAYPLPSPDYQDTTKYYRQFYVKNASYVYSKLTAQDYIDSMMDVNVNGDLNSVITDTVYQIGSFGSTKTHVGLTMAANVLNNNAPRSYVDQYGDTRTGQQIVILFTDGASKSSDTNNYNAANTIKNIRDTKLYAISVGSIGATNETKLNRISSNYADSTKTNSNTGPQKYYYTSDDMDGLSDIFDQILDDVVTSNTELTSSSILRDYVNTGFTLPEGFSDGNIGLKVQNVAWDAENEKYVDGDALNYKVSSGEGTNTITYVPENEGTDAPDSLTLTINPDDNSISVTGFNYKGYAAIAEEGKTGKKIVLTFDGIQVTDDVLYDEEVSTNRPDSGIGNEDESGVFSLVTTFPQPITKVMSAICVMDYAKPLVVDTSKWSKSLTTMVTSPLVQKDENGSTVVAQNISFDDGNFVMGDNKVTFTPKTMNWDGVSTVYAFGKWKDSAIGNITTGENQWTKISALPANNVYYEDDFVTENAKDAEGNDIEDEYTRVGIVYSGKWEESGTNTDTTETPEINETAPNGGVHGWEDAMANDTGDSDGSIHGANADAQDAGKSATATFTFTGKGVDIYSRTTGSTGTVYATLKGTGENGVSVTKRLIVDTVSESGSYYQIPTLSFMTYTDKDTGKEESLPYGTYTVTIKVTKGAETQGRFLYYLDGIRVYNPIKEDDTVKDAYGEKEINAVFKEVRDLLIDANSFGTALDGTAGVVFIDKMPTGGSSGTTQDVLGVYKDYGPKNEVYLAEGQAITFKVDLKDGEYLYVGLKAPNGATWAEVSDGYDETEVPVENDDPAGDDTEGGEGGDNVDQTENTETGTENGGETDTENGGETDTENGDETDTENGDETDTETVIENHNNKFEVKHTTDMYYEVVPHYNGFVTIKNAGTGLLSVTKLRFAGEAEVVEEEDPSEQPEGGEESGDEEPEIEETTEEEIAAALLAFSKAKVYKTFQIIEDEVEIEGPKVLDEETEPVEVTITQAKKEATVLFTFAVENLFKNIVEWFR